MDLGGDLAHPWDPGLLLFFFKYIYLIGDSCPPVFKKMNFAKVVLRKSFLLCQSVLFSTFEKTVEG